jgi:hypothetical protein
MSVAAVFTAVFYVLDYTSIFEVVSSMMFIRRGRGKTVTLQLPIATSLICFADSRLPALSLSLSPAVVDHRRPKFRLPTMSLSSDRGTTINREFARPSLEQLRAVATVEIMRTRCLA